MKNGDDQSALSPSSSSATAPAIDFVSIFYALPGPLLVMDAELRVVAANDAYAAVSHREKHELVGLTVFELFPENPLDHGAHGARNLRASLARVVADRVTDVMAIQKYDIVIDRNQGRYEERYWNPANLPVLDAAGKLIYVIHRVEDVTAYVQGKSREPLVERDIVQKTEEVRQSNLELKEMKAHLVSEQIQYRKSLESALIEVETERHKFSSIFADASTSMSITRGPTHIYEHANPSYQQLFSSRPLVGLSLLEALPELRGQPYPDLFDQVYQTGIAYREREAVAYLRRTAEGPTEERYFDQSYTRLELSSGEPYGVFIHAVEVTDRVFARRAILESESQLKLANETSGLGAWSFDLETNRYSWSRRAAEIYGLPFTEEVDVDVVSERFHPDDRAQLQGDWEALTGMGLPYQVEREHRIIWPDGQVRWVLAAAKAFAADGENGCRVTKIVGTLLDLTDRMQTQLELKRAKEAAEIANAAKSAFLANMSHEIRTPLGAILGFTELLRQRQENDVETSAFFESIDRNGKALTRIIDDILDLAKVETGRLAITTEDFSLHDLVDEVVAIFNERAVAKQIFLRPRSADGLPPKINSDPIRIRQILINIVGNAVKFTQYGGVWIDIGFAAMGGGSVRIDITVADSGMGISKKNRQNLFEPFVQADESATRRFGGTGLGLALSRRLARAIGGDIQILPPSAQGGTSFVISFNAVISTAHLISEPRRAGSAAIAKEHLNERLQGIPVLVADDSKDNQFLVRRILEKQGAIVQTANNGKEALELALRGDFLVVLMDLQMPVMDGYEATRQLRTAGYAGPILALTAHAMAEERDRTREAGCNGHLTKPLNQEQLIATIQDFASPKALD